MRRPGLAASAVCPFCTRRYAEPRPPSTCPDCPTFRSKWSFEWTHRRSGPVRPALHPDQVQATVRSLLRVATGWLTSQGENPASVPRAADEDLLRRVGLLVAKHDAEVPLARVGRSVLRRRDLAGASAVEQVAAIFRGALAGRMSVAQTVDAVSSSLMRVTSKDATPQKIFEWMKLKPENDEELKRWVSQRRGPLEAAIAVVQRFADRGRARRLLQSVTHGAQVPLNEGDDRLLGLVVEAQARGRAVGTVAIVKTGLAALGFSPTVVGKAVAVLLDAHRKEQALHDAASHDSAAPPPLAAGPSTSVSRKRKPRQAGRTARKKRRR